MTNYLHKLKIMQKFFLIFSLILMAVLVSYGVVFWFSAKQKTQGTQIDVAGRNRMLSQRIGVMALLVDSDNEAQASEAREEMRKAIVLVEQSLNALKNGGVAPGIDGNIILPPAPAVIIPKIIEIEEYFKTDKELATRLLNESRFVALPSAPGDSSVTASAEVINVKFKESIDNLRRRIIDGAMLKMNIELTQLFVHHTAESKSVFTIVLFILLAIDALIIAFAFVFLKNTLRPLGPLTMHISGLSNGHIPPPVKISRMDEIGQMAIGLNNLSENLGSATEFAKNVGDGKLDTQVKVFNGKGDLSQSLNVMRDNLKKVAEEDKKRNWTTEGLAKFSEILRSNSDLKPLCENIISNLVKYTESNQGSLFILNDSNTHDIHLELFACYAYNRKKFLEKKILPGEGLAGQAYLEKEIIFMKEVPKNYMVITSGLGEATPTSVLIVPLMLNEEITGIVEIASLREYQPHEISFIEKLSENIASIITGVKINERTQRLLEASQQQAEELKAQEEEMRQNMEELSATQEEMSRKEAEYILRIQKLELQLASGNVLELNETA